MRNVKNWLKEYSVLVLLIIFITCAYIYNIHIFGHQSFSPDTAEVFSIINTRITEDRTPDIQLLVSLLDQFKEYNIVLNTKHNETIKFFLYVISLFAAFFGFFGFKTQREIKQNAKEEAKRVEELYSTNFSLLEEQTKMFNQLYQIGNQAFQTRYDELQKMVLNEREKIELINKEIIQRQMELSDLNNNVKVAQLRLEQLAEKIEVVQGAQEQEREEKDLIIEFQQKKNSKNILESPDLFTDSDEE